MQMNPDYGPRVTWESLDVGARIYYTGDIANQAGTGVITERLPIDPKWNYRQVNIAMDDGRELRAIGLASFQPGPGRRFWLESDWKMFCARKLAESQEVIRCALVAQKTAQQALGLQEEPTRACEQSSYALDSRDLATILAALRFMQRLRPALNGGEHDIATRGGDFESLTNGEIDALCERLNVAPKAKAAEARPEPESETKAEGKPVGTRELVVGDILASSWGYDQTNVCFYQVISRTKAQVMVREIASDRVAGDSWQGQAMPKKDAFTGEPMRRKIMQYDLAQPAIKIDSSETARLWDGKPKSFTAYA